MFQRVQWFVVVGVVIVALQGRVFSQNCSLNVNVRDSSSQNQTVTAVVTPSNCSPLPATMTLQSSDTSIATVPASAQLSQGVFRPPISTRTVNECRTVNITYSAGGGTVTRPLVVCPFAFDPAVTAINVVQSAAGAESTVNVTVRNNGAETLFQNQYGLDLNVVENMTGLVRNSCSSGIGNTVTATNRQFPLEIKAGQQATVSANFRFPQAGNLTLRAQVGLQGGEDGPATNNSMTQAVAVPLPAPLVCEIQAVAGQVDTFTIKGNWFRRFGTADMPTVTAGGGIIPTGLSITSPVQMTVQLPGYSCLASAPNITVGNGSGNTSRTGAALPGPLSITGTTRNELAGHAFDLTFQLANFRPSCTLPPTPYVRMVPALLPNGQPAALGGSFNPVIVSSNNTSITVRLFHGSVLSIYSGRVITLYGTASTPINISAETSIPKLPSPQL